MARGPAVPILLSFLLAGCAGPQDPATGDADRPGPDVDGAAAQSFDSIPAPDWQVGQWWEWELSFGTTTREDTFCSIVVGAEGGSYALATENTDWAKEEAAFDHPLIGTVATSDLAMTGPGGDWSLLAFPLTDGKTWTASMPNIAWDIIAAERAELTMTATFEQRAAGEPPLVHLAGTSGGHTLLQAEYDPATGWFAGLRFYDVDPGQEELEMGYRAKSTGVNYTGPYFRHTAEPLLQLFDANGFDDDPTSGGQPMTHPPQPYHSFIATEGTTLYGYLVAETVAAARAVVLTDPSHQERHFESHDTGLDGTGVALFLDEPSIAGEWRLATAGAGGFSGAFGEIFEVTEGSFTL